MSRLGTNMIFILHAICEGPMHLQNMLPPRMHHKLTKHGRFCKQNNQLPTKTHVELKDNSNKPKKLRRDWSTWTSNSFESHNTLILKLLAFETFWICYHKYLRFEFKKLGTLGWDLNNLALFHPSKKKLKVYFIAMNLRGIWATYSDS